MRDTGQIYLPLVNWGLYVFIVLAVVLFRSSSNLASAYGIAVTLDMTITTVMTFFVIRYGWKYPLWLVPVRHRRSSSFHRHRLLRIEHAQALCRRLVSRWSIGIGMFTLMLHLDERAAKLVSDRLPGRGLIDLSGFLRRGIRQPADARVRHGGVPGRRGGSG